MDWKAQCEAALGDEENFRVAIWERAQRTARCFHATVVVLGIGTKLKERVFPHDLYSVIARMVWYTRSETEWGLWGRPDVKRVWLDK